MVKKEKNYIVIDNYKFRTTKNKYALEFKKIFVKHKSYKEIDLYYLLDTIDKILKYKSWNIFAKEKIQDNILEILEMISYKKISWLNLDNILEKLIINIQ